MTTWDVNVTKRVTGQQKANGWQRSPPAWTGIARFLAFTCKLRRCLCCKTHGYPQPHINYSHAAPRQRESKRQQGARFAPACGRRCRKQNVCLCGSPQGLLLGLGNNLEAAVFCAAFLLTFPGMLASFLPQRNTILCCQPDVISVDIWS